MDGFENLTPSATKRDSKSQAGTALVSGLTGCLKLINFENKKILEKSGDGLYRNKGLPEEEFEALDIKTRQGFLESSNVTSVEEMTEMVGTLRIFESYQKIIQSIDSMNDQSVNTIGRVG